MTLCVLYEINPRYIDMGKLFVLKHTAILKYCRCNKSNAESYLEEVEAYCHGNGRDAHLSK